MGLDLAIFSDKLRRYSLQFDVSVPELTEHTGIPIERLSQMLEQKIVPTGDEILILADFFKCDYNFFISNEKLAPFEQTEALFRKHAASLSKDDKWAIQEFLFLCECEEFLLENMPEKREKAFHPQKKGTFYKGHGRDAASSLRRHLQYQPKEIPRDVFRDFRRIGIHLFRRRLEQSAISGLFVRHPTAGPCVLVNSDEDVFRQRFTAAHEAGHALLDDEDQFIVSFISWGKNNLSEVRANTFASNFLLPPESLNLIQNLGEWDSRKSLTLALQLMVNTETLAIALQEAGLIGEGDVAIIKNAKVPRDMKHDPELPESLAPKVRHRKEQLLQRGLSNLYVELCFEAYERNIITSGRLSEALLAEFDELPELAGMYGRKL